MNGVCHASIVSGGYSPGLGFIHTGKQLSFVYDMADLYKAELTIPAAFQIVGESSDAQCVERRTRAACRDKFKEAKLLERILLDIDELMGIQMDTAGVGDTDADPALPEMLWSPPESIEQEAAP